MKDRRKNPERNNSEFHNLITNFSSIFNTLVVVGVLFLIAISISK